MLLNISFFPLHKMFYCIRLLKNERKKERESATNKTFLFAKVKKQWKKKKKSKEF